MSPDKLELLANGRRSHRISPSKVHFSNLHEVLLCVYAASGLALSDLWVPSHGIFGLFVCFKWRNGTLRFILNKHLGKIIVFCAGLRVSAPRGSTGMRVLCKAKFS